MCDSVVLCVSYNYKVKSIIIREFFIVIARYSYFLYYLLIYLITST